MDLAMNQRAEQTDIRGDRPDGRPVERADAPPPGDVLLGWWARLSFATARAFLSPLLVVLGLRGVYRFGRWFGYVEWLINYKRRRRFAAAYRQVLGADPTDAQRRAATRAFFAQSRCDKLLYLIVDRLSRERAAGLLRVEPQGLLDDAAARGRGVYVALSHHGAHHVCAMLMVLKGYKVAGVRDPREGALRRYVRSRFNRRYPEFTRLRMISSDAYPRDIYRCFQEGYLLGSALDVSRVRRSNQRAETVTIFGEEREFLTGPLRVALRCGAPVMQGFIHSEPDFRYRLEIVDTLLDPNVVTDEAEAVDRAIRRYAANVERCVRATPSWITRI